MILDEAGMVDHKRMDQLTHLIERTGAKLVAVGDGRQLPSIGPGGTFDRLVTHARTVELNDVHRTKDPPSSEPGPALRAGEPERAMAHYHARGRLHLADTRDQAGEQAVQRWAELAWERDPRQVALIADASNVEIDRLNARAQRLRDERGELGDTEIWLPNRNYGLRQGDLITFTAQHRPPGAPKIENGARGEVTHIRPGDVSLTVKLDGSDREVLIGPSELAQRSPPSQAPPSPPVASRGRPLQLRPNVHSPTAGGLPPGVEVHRAGLVR